MWNKNICLTSRKTLLLIVVILFSTLVLASVWSGSENIIEEGVEVPEEIEGMWIPTEEDIAYQDSMYQIIQNTQKDITEIKDDIVYILERLDYPDGTWDSIRYVKGGKIDKRRN
jgi:predicted PurR-regulated permease PerM